MSMTCKNPLTAIVLPCIRCGESEVGINVRLDCLDDDDAQFECRSCGGEFGRSQIEEVVRTWGKLLSWLDMAPDVTAGE